MGNAEGEGREKHVHAEELSTMGYICEVNVGERGIGGKKQASGVQVIQAFQERERMEGRK